MGLGTSLMADTKSGLLEWVDSETGELVTEAKRHTIEDGDHSEYWTEIERVDASDVDGEFPEGRPDTDLPKR